MSNNNDGAEKKEKRKKILILKHSPRAEVYNADGVRIDTSGECNVSEYNDDDYE